MAPTHHFSMKQEGPVMIAVTDKLIEDQNEESRSDQFRDDDLKLHRVMEMFGKERRIKESITLDHRAGISHILAIRINVEGRPLGVFVKYENGKEYDRYNEDRIAKLSADK